MWIKLTNDQEKGHKKGASSIVRPTTATNNSHPTIGPRIDDDIEWILNS